MVKHLMHVCNSTLQRLLGKKALVDLPSKSSVSMKLESWGLDTSYSTWRGCRLRGRAGIP